MGLPSQGGIIEKEAPNFRLELPSKSGDDLLSHKRNEVKFVGAGSIRSHAAWTEFMPVRVAKRRHHQERRALIPVYAKRRVLLELVFS